MPAADAGRAEEPVGEVAQRAAEDQAERDRPAAERIRRAVRRMTTTTTSATTVRMTVKPVPSENAAPELRV